MYLVVPVISITSSFIHGHFIVVRRKQWLKIPFFSAELHYMCISNRDSKKKIGSAYMTVVLGISPSPVIGVLVADARNEGGDRHYAR